MSFIGADGKRYYRFYNADKNGAMRAQSEQERLMGALELNRIFTLRPLTTAIRQAINSPAYQR